MWPNSNPRASGSGNRRARRNRNRFPTPPYRSGVGHVNFVSSLPSDFNESEPREHVQIPFIIRRSLQEEAREVSERLLFDASFHSFTVARSGSYAQVATSAVMPRLRRGIHPAHDPKSGAAEDMDSENASSSTLVPLRLSSKSGKKKARKWSPLDLSAIDSPAESSSSPITTRSQSPNSPVPARHPTPSIVGPQHIHSQGTERADFYGDQIGGQLSGFQPGPSNIFEPCPLPRASLLQERSIIHKEDSPETKKKIAQIMSRFDEAFDVEEWDPDLPSAGLNNSPETLQVKPQVLAYTTVGSLVRSDAAPKFNPPIRLQREGAGRRPPLPQMQPRAMNNYHLHDHQVNMPNPLGQNSVSQDYYSNLRHSARLQTTQQNLPRQPHTLSEPEKEILLQGLGVSKQFVTDNHHEAMLRTLGVSKSTIRSDNTHLPAYNQPTYQDAREPGKNLVDVQELVREAAASLGSGSQGTVAGLEKMQTLQRLAKFENPAREFAKERLSEFAVAKNNNVNTTGSSANTSMTYDLNHQMSNMTLHQVEREHFRPESGQLDYKFKFPPVRREENPYSYTNPLFMGNAPHPADSHYPSPLTGNAPNPRTRYPQPLKAGPPGQRQAVQGFNTQQWGAFEEVHSRNTQNFNDQYYHNNTTLPQREDFNNGSQYTGPVYDQIPMNPIPVSNKVVRDTLTADEARKYFPNGFPRGFGQEYVRPNDASYASKFLGQTTFPQSGHLEPPKTKEQSKKEYEDKLNKWFYSGLPRSNMVIDDYVQELEGREFERTMGYNPLTPLTPSSLESRSVVQVDQVKEMSEAECIAPRLHNLFGTLLSYADRNAGPNNKSALSKFTTPPAWCVDDSARGNDSFYGEDWGPAPKRLGRDPRYQGGAHDSRSSMW